jgi:hypothetical protein
LEEDPCSLNINRNLSGTIEEQEEQHSEFHQAFNVSWVLSDKKQSLCQV